MQNIMKSIKSQTSLIIHIVFLIKTSYIFLDTIIILYIKEQQHLYNLYEMTLLDNIINFNCYRYRLGIILVLYYMLCHNYPIWWTMSLGEKMICQCDST